MKTSEYILKGLLHGAATTLYITAVALFFFNAGKIFGDGQTFFIPIFILLLFVISACVTGALVLGRPLYFYLHGHAKDAIALFFATLAWLVVFMVVIGGVLFFAR